MSFIAHLRKVVAQELAARLERYAEEPPALYLDIEM